jgi:hypothetical protein
MADDSTEPRSTEYFYEPFWNMMQVVAWVYTRAPEMVHRASGRNSDYGTYFAEVTVPGGERRLAELSGGPVSITHLLLSRLLREGKDAPNLDVHVAMRAVMHALCDGRLPATGIPAGGVNPEKIEADAWAYLELFESDRHEVCARLSDGPHKYELRYSGLKVKRGDALAIWPCWSEVETQLCAARRAAGRYQLREAAEEIAQHTGERADVLVKKLMQAVSSAAIPVYRPGESQTYMPETVRDFYEEAHAGDLNAWLLQNEPRIAWRFPFPPESSSSDISPSAGEIGLSKRERQIRAIETAADEAGIPRMEVPTGGKKKLQSICKKRHSELFGAGDDPFKEAWQEAVDQKRLRMKDHDKFATR